MTAKGSGGGCERPRCLLLYVEPTPYVNALIEYIRSDTVLEYRVFFITRNASQQWNADANIDNATVLWEPSASAWQGIARTIHLAVETVSGRFKSAHIAGWGHAIMLLTMVSLRIGRVPFSLESDTQLALDQNSFKQWLKRRMYPFMFRWPSTFLPSGTRQANYFRFYGVAPEQIQLACMGVDSDHIRSIQTADGVEWKARLHLDEQHTVFLFVGRLVPCKGTQDLLSAFDQLVESVPNARLVIVGDGPLQPQISNAAIARAGQVFWLGRQDMRGVVESMRASDVLVVPSHRDQWGLVVNEGLACGLPVIASASVGAVDDLVTDGYNGLVVKTGSVSALADAMRVLAENVSLRMEMAANSYVRGCQWTSKRTAEIIRSAILAQLKKH